MSKCSTCPIDSELGPLFAIPTSKMQSAWRRRRRRRKRKRRRRRRRRRRKRRRRRVVMMMRRRRTCLMQRAVHWVKEESAW